MDRRRLLAFGAATGVAALTSCSIGSSSDDSAESASCSARRGLEAHSRLGRLPLVYEVSRNRSRFFFDSGFFTQLQGWLAFYRETSGDQLDQVWTFGSWTNGGSACDSWHNSGRAFDLSRLRRSDGTFVSCRYDRWRHQAPAKLEVSLRNYWRLAASAHLHFAYVLTYLYDAAHLNHIHLDNGRSGAALSTLDTGSRVQIQAVQAICSHLWEAPVEVTDQWDRATRRASRGVLERIGVAGDLDDSTENWHAFLRASAAAG